MQAIDIVLPEPKTELEKHNRWMNRMTVQFKTAPYARAKKIEVTKLHDCDECGEPTGNPYECSKCELKATRYE